MFIADMPNLLLLTVFWEIFSLSRQRTGLDLDRYRLGAKIPDFIGYPLRLHAKVQKNGGLGALIRDERSWTLLVTVVLRLALDVRTLLCRMNDSEFAQRETFFVLLAQWVGRLAKIGRDCWGEISVSNALEQDGAVTAVPSTRIVAANTHCLRLTNARAVTCFDGRT